MKMSRLFLLPWILVLFCGCIIVKSDATRVDPETGAIHVDLTHSEDPEEADDPEEEDDDLDEGTVSTQRDKVEDLQRKFHKAEIKMEIARFQRELAEDEQHHQEREEERAVEEARRELHLFERFGEPEKRHQAQQSLGRARNGLRDAEAELEQLTTLYEGSELEDGTAELVLTRGRVGLERARRSLQQEERDHELTMQIEIPHEREALERALSEATRSQERGRIEREIAGMERELEEEERQVEFDKMQEELEEARHDLRELTGEEVGENPIAWRLF